MKVTFFTDLRCSNLLEDNRRQLSVIRWCSSLLARQNLSIFTALACSHEVGAVLLSDVGSFLQRVAAFDCSPAECDKADQTFADDADDLLRFSINSSYYSLMGDFCQNALSSSASSAKAPQCSQAEPCLVRHFDTPYELVGGTPEDRATTAECCSLFAPDGVFSGTPRRIPVSAFAV